MSFWRKLRWSIAQRGLLGTIAAVPAALARSSAVHTQHPFDQRFGTDTSGLLGGGSLTSGHPHDIYITGYAGIPPSRFEAAIQRWSGTLSPHRIQDYTFIDLGCGKGRVLLLASRLPFREVTGLELNPELAAIAERNVERWRTLGHARCPIRIDVADASNPALSAGPVLLFLYNAFAARLVRQLADNITQSNHRERVDLLYQNAYHAQEFTQKPQVFEVWRAELPLSGEDAAADPVASPHDATVLLRVDAAAATRV